MITRRDSSKSQSPDALSGSGKAPRARLERIDRAVISCICGESGERVRTRCLNTSTASIYGVALRSDYITRYFDISFLPAPTGLAASAPLTTSAMLAAATTFASTAMLTT